MPQCNAATFSKSILRVFEICGIRAAHRSSSRRNGFAVIAVGVTFSASLGA
jgi:hypothetical protein